MAAHQAIPYRDLIRTYLDAVSQGLPPLKTVSAIYGVNRSTLEKRLADAHRHGWLARGFPTKAAAVAWLAESEQRFAAKVAEEATVQAERAERTVAQHRRGALRRAAGARQQREAELRRQFRARRAAEREREAAVRRYGMAPVLDAFGTEGLLCHVASDLDLGAAALFGPL
jgi:hypothetical protein